MYNKYSRLTEIHRQHSPQLEFRRPSHFSPSLNFPSLYLCCRRFNFEPRAQERRAPAGAVPARRRGGSPVAPRPDFLLQLTQVSTLGAPSRSPAALLPSYGRRRCPLRRQGHFCIDCKSFRVLFAF
jgi:hypothetical protein